jgi:pilus assembly protein CpaC
MFSIRRLFPAFVALAGLLLAAQMHQARSAEPKKVPERRVELDVVVAEVRGGIVPQRLTATTLEPVFEARAARALLKALTDEGLATVITEPRLVTIAGRHASFLDGGEQAIPVPTGLGSVGVQFEEFDPVPRFFPTVLANGKIQLTLDPEGSTLVPSRVADIARGCLRLTVELEPGHTFVVAGLSPPRGRESKVKGQSLSDVPLTGTLYGNATTEWLILVTPHFVDAADAVQAPKVLPGKDTRSPDDFELFLEGVLESPRGPHQDGQVKKYVPASKSCPTGGTCCPCR